MPPIDRDEVRRRFQHYAPSPETTEVHHEVRRTVRTAASNLADILPECREKSLAITALEEAMYWANAAIARPRAD